MSHKSFSSTLIILCCIITWVSFFSDKILIYGMNSFFITQGLYFEWIMQLMLYQFLHDSVLHLLSNGIFLYIFGNQVEKILGSNKFIILFLLNTIFVSIALLIFSTGNTIGISGFAMTVLAYIFMELRTKKHPEYTAAGVFLIINIAIGFTGNISLVGHLSGAIFGVIFYYLRNNMKIGFLR